jgi:hypothetical protein
MFGINNLGKVVGRLATQIASLLLGKHKTRVRNERDDGDYVVVYNAKKVCVCVCFKRELGTAFDLFWIFYVGGFDGRQVGPKVVSLAHRLPWFVLVLSPLVCSCV